MRHNNSAWSDINKPTRARSIILVRDTSYLSRPSAAGSSGRPSVSGDRGVLPRWTLPSVSSASPGVAEESDAGVE